MKTLRFIWRPFLMGFAVTLWAQDSPAADAPPPHALRWSLYVDGAYAYSSKQPENHQWRTKSTTATLNRARLNNATVAMEKTATFASPWGFMAGAQAGDDVDRLVGAGASDSDDKLKHLYYTNFSLRLRRGKGLQITGGLIPGLLGYASFQAFDNAAYTRIYGTDLVPYFNWGVSLTHGPDLPVSSTFYVMNGWHYLASPNNVPSYGAKFQWMSNTGGRLIQNFYYGPEQADTAREFWRFVTNTIFEVGKANSMLAGEFGYGREKQAVLDGNPQYDWWWAALWLKWRVNPKWQGVLRPEILSDEDGLAGGARQTITAITVGMEGRGSENPKQDIALRLEYRFDKSTGAEGGFYEGATNRLTPGQHAFMVALIWKFGTPATGRE